VTNIWHSLRPVSTEGWVWFCFGMCGNVVFGSRFFVQWLYSEKYKESRIPEIFWWLSVLGTFILMVYFIHRRELVGMLGNGPNLIPYARNLMLIYAKKRRDAAAALELGSAPAPEQDPGKPGNK
jgi:lipid-A-disaccharide synthase-like uncharacterized protein